MIQDLLEKQNTLENKIAKKREEIEKQQELLDSYKRRTYWGDSIVKPIAIAIKKQRGYYSYEMLGPFGLSCDLSVWFWKTKEDAKERDLSKMVSLSFRPSSNEKYKTSLVVTYFNGDADKYPKGSVGYNNGFNKKTKDVTDWTINDLIVFMDKQNIKKIVKESCE